MSVNHQTSIAAINAIEWHLHMPESIIYTSFVMAREFAESLRAVMRTPSLAPSFAEMAKEELDTDNLQFEDYMKRGDHYEFLWYFISEGVSMALADTMDSDRYRQDIRRMSVEDRAMSIVSRKRELSDTFAKILAAHDWEALGFGFYAYYLKRLMELHAAESGCAHLLKNFPRNNAVLDTFWALHLEIYRELLIKY